MIVRVRFTYLILIWVLGLVMGITAGAAIVVAAVMQAAAGG